jgi:hypothetical protein
MLTVLAAPAWAAAPSFYGNTDIATRIKQGDANVVFLGDSIQNVTQGEYLRRWPVQKFVGQFVGENVGQNTGAGTWGLFSYPWLGAHYARLPDDPPAPNGYTGIAPAAVYHAHFNAQPVAADDNILSNRVYAMELSPNQPANYFGGNWANRSDGQIHVDLLVYANPQGLASGLKFDVRGNSLTTPLAGTPISSYSATPEIRKYSLSFDAQTWDPNTGLSAAVRMQAGTTPTQDSNLIVIGSRFSTGESGFQMTNIAWGGKGIDYYTDPANTSNENLGKFFEYTDSDIALIWLGQNHGNIDKQTYKSKMLTLVDRYKTARPGMQFALVSTYDTGSALLSDFADALHEIAQDDPSVLFLNLYGAAGSYAFLDQTYLSDHVHPTPEGSRYMADTLWGLIDSAAQSNVPEPAGLTLVAAGAVMLLRRWPRRAASSR